MQDITMISIDSKELMTLLQEDGFLVDKDINEVKRNPLLLIYKFQNITYYNFFRNKLFGIHTQMVFNSDNMPRGDYYFDFMDEKGEKVLPFDEKQPFFKVACPYIDFKEFFAEEFNKISTVKCGHIIDDDMRKNIGKNMATKGFSQVFPGRKYYKYKHGNIEDTNGQLGSIEPWDKRLEEDPRWNLTNSIMKLCYREKSLEERLERVESILRKTNLFLE